MSTAKVAALLLLCCLCLGSGLILSACQPAAPSPTVEERPSGLLLIPLDSRPVNTQHLALLARMAGERLIMPPPELLDCYTAASDSDGLLTWLEQHIGQVDKAIIATNNLLAGGLIASRHAAAYQAADTRLERLLSILGAQPAVNVTLISVLPRQLPTQFNNPGWANRQQLVRYGQLLDKAAQQLAEGPELAELRRLTDSLPQAIRQDYQAVYTANRDLGQRLLQAIAAGSVDNLVLTLDDASRFGLSNLYRRELLQTAAAAGLSDRVHALTGADETSMLALARLLLEQSGLSLAWQVHYERTADRELVLRYESESLATAIGEKIAFVGGSLGPVTGRLELFVHARPGTSRLSELTPALQQAHAAGRLTGVIDVALINQSDQPFMRALLEQAGRESIDSYAGWNTASNSIGSVVAHLAVRSLLNQQLAAPATDAKQQRQQLAADLEYRWLHLADEGSYQAVTRAALGAWAKRQQISTEPIPAARLAAVNAKLNELLGPELATWSTLLTGEYRYRLSDQSMISVTVHGWQWTARLPWPRLFEVELVPRVELAP